jgi:hypothetical protein
MSAEKSTMQRMLNRFLADAKEGSRYRGSLRFFTPYTIHPTQKIALRGDFFCIYAIFLLPLRDFSYTNGILV